METRFRYRLIEPVEIDLDRFGQTEGSGKLLDAIRARDESAITAYCEANPNSGELLLAALLFLSRETPYSYVIPPAAIELVKNNTTSSTLISTVMSFWKDKPSTGLVLVLKYVDMNLISLVDVISWLLHQDSWMSKSWGWELTEICFTRASAPKEDIGERKSKDEDDMVEGESDENQRDNVMETMQVDSERQQVNGTNSNQEVRELFGKIVAGVAACCKRQGEWDQYWLKEWFAMVVRRYWTDETAVFGTDWVEAMLHDAEKYRSRLI